MGEVHHHGRGKVNRGGGGEPPEEGGGGRVFRREMVN